MLAQPEDEETHQNKQYLQATADDEENVIGDCAKITNTDVSVEVYVEIQSADGTVVEIFEGCDNAVVVRESSTASSGEGGIQTKYYCPHIGLVLIDGTGGIDGQEMAELVSIRFIETSCKPPSGEILEWQRAVLEMEGRAYAAGLLDNELSPEPYLPPNVFACDPNDQEANCPNHEPIKDPCDRRRRAGAGGHR